MYLHFGYPLHDTNSPYCPVRRTSCMPHFGQFSSRGTGGFCCCFAVSLRIVLHGGSSLYPGQAMNWPNGPLRSTITRPQFSQNSSSASAPCASGVFRFGFASKFSRVNLQLTCSTTSLRSGAAVSANPACNSFRFDAVIAAGTGPVPPVVLIIIG